MFGYIRTCTPELRVREHECYRAAYCGLCHEMGRCTGCTSRLTLSYDFVFLTLLRLCVTGEVPSFTRRRCVAHPLSKRPTMKKCGALTHCARCAAILNYWKNRDDRDDERGIKRLRAACLHPVLAGGRRRAKKAYAELDGRIAERLSALSDMERERVESADLPAGVFGELVREFCAFGLEGAAYRIAAELGYYTGRWIYLVDALDDREKDARTGSYNPFVLLYGGGELSDDQKASLNAALTAELMGVERALDLLEEAEGFPEGLAILRNILYLGMPETAKGILYGKSNEENELANGND